MSKKNNKGTKRRIHANDLAREKAEREKREKAQAKAQAKEEQRAPPAPPSSAGPASAALVALVSGGVAKKSKKARPVRIKRGVVIKGVRIRDADDKRRALKLLAAEAKLKERRAAAAAAAAAANASGGDASAAALAAASAGLSKSTANKSLFGGVKRLKASKGKRVAIIAGRKKVMVEKKPGPGAVGVEAAAAGAVPAGGGDVEMET
jgi:hypothetical protein